MAESRGRLSRSSSSPGPAPAPSQSPPLQTPGKFEISFHIFHISKKKTFVRELYPYHSEGVLDEEVEKEGDQAESVGKHYQTKVKL